ncbi:AraC family transcriptional regulator [Pseudodesulfovibrio sediminis]|uniref:AraC family transcriptional regulator n=1 Tax=Pseudodesulfovibrio sediminis TaxID=2810563 RepID=A0ABM7P8I7_9BACT|nr:AraC family transcriptional regulator [Pseudodesulfovibrio sediminis]BCS89331.1 AraC family transcriptional regulator [Pseudodesulfovibrio sediminis]
MARERSKEHSHVSTLPILGGVEMLRARFVTQSFSRHFHEGFAVGCIDHGAMRFNYLGQNVVASRGQVNLVVPGEVHDGHSADETGWAYRMFYLRPEALMEAATALMAKPRLPHFRMGVIDDPALASCILRTHTLMECPDISLIEKETQLLWLLTNWISRYAEDAGSWPKDTTEHGAVNRAREIIEDRFSEDLSLTELARLSGLSPYHLVRVFEKQLGVTPHAHLTQTRVKRARERLAGTDRMADIAMECGFSDQAHLTRLFKRQLGITPGKYRKIIQNS